MFKRLLLWVIPLLVLAIMVVCFVILPMTHSHAASTNPSHSVSDSTTPSPNYFWYP
jgi:cytochrome c-type biogenesis protein CcmH/NrfF